MIDWLYSKGDNCTDFQKLLRVHMLLTWNKSELEKLKFTKNI